MGYYSDVALITTKEGWNIIKHNVQDKAPDEAEYLVSEDLTEIERGGKYIFYLLPATKWYEGYFSEVDAFMEALKELNAREIPYEYMRVGEDYGDVEKHYADTYMKPEYDDFPSLCLNRQIEVEDY